MTEIQTGLEPGPSANEPVTGSIGKRVREWFWRGAALENWRRTAQLLDQGARELETRAQSSADLALVAWSAESPFGDALACELYRQAAYWSLCAFTPGLPRHEEGRYSAAVWAALAPSLADALASAPAQRDLMLDRLRTGTFVSFAELSPRERVATRAAFRDLTAALLTRVRESRAGRRRLEAQRFSRLAGLALLVIAIVIGLASLPGYLRELPDRAVGASWRTSSTYGGGCTSPDQTCEGTGGWFFHTGENDRDPWIEFDLGVAKSVSAVVVENRSDCCAERAVPLTVELSDDGRTWRQVAERREVFDTWQARFPSTNAAFVRLRVTNTVALHLKRVHILR